MQGPKGHLQGNQTQIPHAQAIPAVKVGGAGLQAEMVRRRVGGAALQDKVVRLRRTTLVLTELVYWMVVRRGARCVRRRRTSSAAPGLRRTWHRNSFLAPSFPSLLP